MIVTVETRADEQIITIPKSEQAQLLNVLVMAIVSRINVGNFFQFRWVFFFLASFYVLGLKSRVNYVMWSVTSV